MTKAELTKGERLKSLPKFALLLLLLVTLGTAPFAHSQQGRIFNEGRNWAQEITGSLNGAKNVHIKVDICSVRVEGGSQSGITYTVHSRANPSSEDAARRQFQSYKLNAYVRGDTAWIVSDWQGDRPRKFSGEMVVTVPQNIDWIKVESEGGNIMTTNIAGRLDAESGGGSIHLENIGGAINAETGGGGIDVGAAGSDVTLHTGGGSIKIASAKGKIAAESGGGSVVVLSGLRGAVLETGGGSIRVTKCNGTIKATTGGGSIELGDIGGQAEIETGGGSIRLVSASGSVHAETGGGSIELNGVPSAHAETGSGPITVKLVSSSGAHTDSMLETSAGDITVYIAPNVNVTVRASIEVANGHSIRSDFPEIHVTSEGGQWGPKTYTAEGNVNGGGPVLKVRTTTGDISFRKTMQ
ncbi:MAG: DUF4097 domain-containing protein [Acidobacteriota bacterium]|nr:DUF4097 domain-containing protein [Acidobacteriota bacterium]